MGKKILDINPYPVARAYTYHAYPLSILSSKKYVGEKKIELLIEGKTSDFEVETVNSRYDITDNIFTLTADDYAEDVKLVINYSSLKLFERAFKIIYFQYTQPCAYLAITILDKYSSKEKANVYLYRNGSISSTGWNNLNTMNKTLKKIEGFKFRINKNDVVFEILKDGEECEKLHTKLDKTYKDYSINITAFLGENQYYNWFFSNYIQLYGRNIFSVEYFNDYFIAPERKNSLMYTIHSFLEYHHINRNILKKCNIDLINFLKANIEEGNYIEVVLNHKYIGAAGYQLMNHLHQTLVYGYSDDDNILYIEMIGKDRKVKSTTISYIDFINAAEVNYERIVVIKYDPPEQLYCLNISNIIESLNDYLQGKDSEEGVKNILQRDFSKCEDECKNVNYTEKDYLYLDRYKNIYGYNLYSFFLNNQKMFDYMLRDIRIAYVWKEHKEIMVERIKFLQYRKKIDFEKGENLINDAISLRNKTEIVLNLCIKYKLYPNIKKIDTIKQLLTTIMEEEKNLLNKLIEALQEMNRSKIY